MVLHKPKKKKITGIKIRGIITEISATKKDQWFIFDIRPKNRDFRDELKELRPRIQKIKDGKEKYFRSPYLKNTIVQLIYLNWESALGRYKNPENNLPYEVLDIYGNTTLYRQSRSEKKEDIFERLEKLAVEEGLRNTD